MWKYFLHRAHWTDSGLQVAGSNQSENGEKQKRSLWTPLRAGLANSNVVREVRDDLLLRYDVLVTRAQRLADVVRHCPNGLDEWNSHAPSA